jgi:hypothetical protein
MRRGFMTCLFTALFASACGMGMSESTQKLPIGSACVATADCGTGSFMCMTEHTGGYCTRMCEIKNGDADCPSEAICQYDGKAGECHKRCDAAADCRTGYVCAPASTAATNQASHAFCDMAD